MSYQRAYQTINLQPTQGIAHLENLDHPQFMQELIGYNPWDNPRQAYIDAYQALDVDWIIGIPDRCVKIDPNQSSYHAEDGTVFTEWGLSGSAWREEYQFHDAESVLAFDPVMNTSGEKLVTREYNQQQIDRCRADQQAMGNSAIVTGIYYTTLFQFGIMIFDWELFLATAASAPKRFQKVLEGFAEVSRRNLSMWAEEDMPLLFMHDDIAMEQGMVFNPEWYRKTLFPLYEYIIEPVKARKDMKLVFVSDGNFNAVLDDLVAIGFDGFVINSPLMDIEEIANRFGSRIFLAGGINTNVLTLGRPEDVVREVNTCLKKVRSAGGFFMHSGGDLPHNIPVENMRAYFSVKE
jgi:hypothetical protein